MEPLCALRWAALREAAGEIVPSAELVELALDAVVAGHDGPALIELAGLTRTEESDAHDVFVRVVAEAGLWPPATEREARLELVRSWCRMLVDDTVPRADAATELFTACFKWSGRPPQLEPLAEALMGFELHAAGVRVDLATVLDEVVEAARSVVRQQ